MTDQAISQPNTQPTGLLANLSPELGARVQEAAAALLVLQVRSGDDPYIYEMSHFLTRFRELEPAPLAQSVRTLLDLIDKGILTDNTKANYLQFPRPDVQRQWAAEYLYNEYLSDPDRAAYLLDDLEHLFGYLRDTLFYPDKMDNEEKLDRPFSQILVKVLEMVDPAENYLDTFLTNVFDKSGHISLGKEFLLDLEGNLADRTQQLLRKWKIRTDVVKDHDRAIFQEALKKCSWSKIVEIRKEVFASYYEPAPPPRDQLIDSFLHMLDKQGDKQKWLALLGALHKHVKDMETSGTTFIDFPNCASKSDITKIQDLFKFKTQLNSPAAWQSFLGECGLSGQFEDAELAPDNIVIIDKIMARAPQAIIKGSGESILRQLLRGAYYHSSFNDEDRRNIDPLMEKYHVPYDS